MKLLSKEQVGSLYAISSGLCYGFLGYFGVQLLKSNLSIANMLFWRFLVAAFFTFIILMFKGKNIFQPLTENLKITFYGIAFYGTSSITYCLVFYRNIIKIGDNFDFIGIGKLFL